MKKAGILIVLLALAGGGILVYQCTTMPRAEGVARLRMVKAKPAASAPFDAFFIEKQVDVSRRQPDSILDLPAKADSEAPLYFTCIIRDAIVPGVIYRGQKQWTIYTDTNLNGKLSDEKRITGLPQKVNDSRTDYIFGPVSFASSSVSAIPAVYFVYSGFVHISHFPAYTLTGKIRLGDSVYRIGLLDGDYDGKYTTRYTPRADSSFYINGDVFAIDLNHDGTYYSWYSQPFRETFPLSRYFKFENTIYEIDVSAKADRLRLRPTKPPMGTLKIGRGKTVYCHFYSQTLSCAADFTDVLALPAGGYAANGGTLEVEDADGTIWRFIDGTFHENGALKEFTIQPNQTLAIQLGPPFKITTSIYKINDTITIRPSLVGASGETFSVHLYKNGVSQPEPIIKILDENNKEVHVGTMEYG